MRRESGLTGRALADRVDISQAKISKIETGRVLPSPDDVDTLCRGLDVPVKRRRELVEQARLLQTEFNSWRLLHRQGFAQKQRDIRELEASTLVERVFQTRLVPALLQTADYARHLLSGKGLNTMAVAEGVAARLERQAVLLDQRKRFEFLITEGALRAEVSPAATLREQLNHLLVVSELPNVRIGVLPWTTIQPFLPHTSFTMFDDSLVAVETLTAEVMLHDAKDVEQYVRAFGQAAATFSFDGEARDVLRKVVDSLSE